MLYVYIHIICHISCRSFFRVPHVLHVLHVVHSLIVREEIVAIACTELLGTPWKLRLVGTPRNSLELPSLKDSSELLGTSLVPMLRKHIYVAVSFFVVQGINGPTVAQKQNKKKGSQKE